MKKCSQCSIDKELDMFNKDKSSKDEHRSNCKDCSRKYREKTADKQKEYGRKYRLDNGDKLRELSRGKYEKDRKDEYYILNKESILQKRKIYYENNKERKIEYQKEYQKNNKSKRNLQLTERRKSDPLYRLITNIRNLINMSFYEFGYAKTSRTQEILGCSFEELKTYLESKFELWMTWENRGIYTGEFNDGWDIDHVIPLSSADSEEELVRLNNHLNLQPLCSKVNRDIKKDSTIYGTVI